MRRKFRLVVRDDLYSRDLRCRTDDYGKCVRPERVYRHEKVTVSLPGCLTTNRYAVLGVYVSHT